jgi:hypothetical protein
MTNLAAAQYLILGLATTVSELPTYNRLQPSYSNLNSRNAVLIGSHLLARVAVVLFGSRRRDLNLRNEVATTPLKKT